MTQMWPERPTEGGGENHNEDKAKDTITAKSMMQPTEYLQESLIPVPLIRIFTAAIFTKQTQLNHGEVQQ